MDMIAESWALADASGAGQRPRTGDQVILEDGVLGTVEDPGADDCGIQVVAGEELLARNWRALVLPGI